MAEGERYLPMDLFVLQPAGKSNDPNRSALDKTWGDGQRWSVIYNVVDLLHHVRTKCGDNFYVRLLRIGGHANTDRFRLGDTLVSDGPIKKGDTIITSVFIDELQSWLKEIYSYFREGKSMVILDHCYIGQNDVFLKKISKAFGGVPVMAPLDGQVTNEGPPRLEGKARVCNDSVCLLQENVVF